jgi:hypothetical protein
MAGKLRIRVNERLHDIEAAPDAPLLYVLSGELQVREFPLTPARMPAALRPSERASLKSS